MKQFNLDEYLKNPDRKVVMRNGNEVRNICTDIKNDRLPIAAVIPVIEGGECIAAYTSSGKYFGYEEDLCYDLFFAPEKHEGWINICKGVYYNDNRYVKYARIFNSKENAEKAIEGDSDYITTLKIEWEE